MTFTEAEIEKRLGDKGPIWRPDPTKQADLHSLDGFADNFLGRFTSLFKAVAALKAPKIHTHLLFVDQNSINGAAAPLSKLDYLVYLHRGTVERHPNRDL